MRIKNIIFPFLMLISLLFNQIWGQTYFIKNYNENDGLGSSIVNDIKQDTTGRMWFATRTGISVYDGYEWKSYNQNDGLQAMTYFRIKIDEKGIVWCLANNRLSISYFVNNKWFSVKVTDAVANETQITSFELIYWDNEVALFFGTLKAGLLLYHQNEWKRLTIKDGLPSNSINSLVVLEQKLYVATNKGISIYDGTSFDNSINISYPFPSNRIMSLAVEKIENTKNAGKRLWIHGFYWLGYIQDKRFKIFSRNAKIKFEFDQPSVILQPDKHGGVFLASLFDIYYFKRKNHQKLHIGREKGIISEGATSLFIDREKNLWIGTRRGVSKIVSRRFTNFRKNDGLLEDEVSAIIEYRPGEFVFGHGNGLTLYTWQGFQTVKLTANESSEYMTRVLDLKLDRDKNVWIAASHLGLGRLVQDSVIFYGKEFGLPENITSIIEYSPGQLLVSTPKHIYLFDGTRFTPFEMKSILQRTSIPSFRKIFKDRYGNFYFCTTANGIFILRNNKWSCVQHENPNINSVYSICHDSQNRIWVGTLAGVYLLNERGNQLIESTDFKIERPVYLIFEDHKKRIWFGTDKGVFRWDNKKLNAYTSNEGLVGQEVNRSAGIVDRLGRIWIGCDVGVSCYEEEFDYQEDQIPPPKVEVDRLDLGIDVVPLNRDNKLSYDKKLFIFQFRGISFINEQAISYRTMLEGFDEDFTLHQFMEDPFVRYTNLKPGSYRFLVQAKSKSSKWSKVVSSGEIIIKEPFWRTTTFLVSVLALIIILILIVVWIRFSVLKKQKIQQEAFAKRLIEEIENGKKKIAHDLHDGIGQDLLITKSELQTLSTEINKQTEAKARLASLEDMISSTIQDVRDLTSELHPHILEQLGLVKAIESIIKRLIQTTKISFCWELQDINSIFPKPLQIHIFRIIQEGLNNIVKHSRANKAKIHVKIMDNLLHVLIQDDGKGFVFKSHLFEQESRGFGLNSIFERVKILRGTCRIYSAPMQGTSIKINIPIERKTYEKKDNHNRR
ncbi:hypothetical protein JW964_06630 [candidate division KSB1 bacterium]|nr:hypothetical protein [candidate division KSB1 bacterium]